MTGNMPSKAKTWAVVPVKDFDEAKQRLADILTRRERRQLAKLMLEDVLLALRQTPGLAGIIVVTRDSAAKGLADSYGIRVLIEPENQGQSAAVSRASRLLARENAAGMLTVPGDIPLITPQELATVLKCHGPGPAMTIVPAWDRRGSNCILCSPPDLIPFHFGMDSFEPHLNEAKNLGIEPEIMALPSAGLDVDGLVEIAMMLEKPVSSRAQAFLEETGISSRVRARNQAAVG